MKALAFVLGLAILAMGAVSFAADDAAPKAQDVTGKIAVAKDEKGAATKITITAADGKALEVKMDDAAKALVEHDGKMVKVTGTSDGKVITVTKHEPVAEKPAGEKKAEK